MGARDEWKKIQAVLGTKQDGVPGKNDELALARLKSAARSVEVVPENISDDHVDERSEKNIATLLPPVQVLARKLVRAASEKGITIKVISGTRTYAEQQALFDQGRTKPGPKVTNARPGSSWHNHSVALDVGVFKNGEYVDDGPEYRIVGQIGKALGFEWGGDWTGLVDEPHFQLTNGKSLAQARALHDQGRNVFSA